MSPFQLSAFVPIKNTTNHRSLRDLAGVGKATLGDFRVLGIDSVAALAKSDPQELYDRLCAITGQRHDICCLDVFHCTVAQARDPHLPVEQRKWWYWSQRRKLSA